MSSLKINKIFIAGISSRIGLEIAKELLNIKNLNIIGMLKSFQNEDDSMQKNMNFLKDQGVKIIEGDVCNPEKYQDQLKDVNVIISTLQGGKDCILEGQKKLYECGLKNGNLKYFFPSDFVVDFYGLAKEEFPWLAWRKEFAEWIDQKNDGVKVVHVFNGCFMELFFDNNLGICDMNSTPKKLNYYGTDDIAFEMTTMKDTAKFVCNAIFGDSAMPPSKFNIAGDIVTPKQIQETFDSFNGKGAMELNKKGDYKELQKEYKAIRDKFKNENVDFSKYIPYSIQLTIFKEQKNKPTINFVNSRYPNLKTTTLSEYLKTAKLSSG